MNAYVHRQSRWIRATTHRIYPQETDLAYLKILFDHGHTSSDMLHARVRPSTRYQYTATRLMHLLREPNAYIYRHHGQRDNYNANCRHLFYDLEPAGVALLASAGLVTREEIEWRRKLRSRGQPREFFHDALTAHVTNSLALGAHAFLPSFRTLAKAPAETRASRRPLTMADHNLTPDDFFAIKYPNGGHRFFALETDMATEPIFRKAKGSSFARKLNAYSDVYRSHGYKPHYGTPSMLVLVVTTNPVRMHSLMKVLQRVARDEKWQRAFLFRQTTHPREKLPATDYLFREPWETTDGPFDISKM